MNFDFQTIKEIANLYGITVEEVEDGSEGFVVDETGEVKKSLPYGIFNDFLKCSKSARLEKLEYSKQVKEDTKISMNVKGAVVDGNFTLAA